MDDIAVNITCDASELTSGMTASRDQVEQTTVSIQRQEASWGAMAVTALKVTAELAGPIISLVSAQRKLQAAVLASAAANAAATPPTLTFGAAVNFALSPVVLIAGGLAIAAGALLYFASSEEEATGSTVAMTQSVAAAATGLDEVSRFAEAIEASAFGQALSNNLGEVWSAVGDVKAAFDDLGDAIEAPFIAAGFEAGNLFETIVGLNSKLQVLTAGLRATADVIGTITTQTQAAIREAEVLGRMAFNFGDRDAAEAAVAKREAEQAAALEALRAGKAAATATEVMKKLTEDATRAVREQGEVAAISALTTVEAINAQEAAIQAKLTAQARAGELDAEAQAHAKDLIDALARQREAIKANAAEEEARREKERAAEQAKEQARIAADKAAQQAALNRGVEDAADRIARLKDQYDLLTNAVTQTDLAVRDSIVGATAEQAEQIEMMIRENARLEKEKQDAAGGSGGSGGRFEVAKTSKAAFAGSSEAASLLLRGVVKDPVAQKQLAVQIQTLAAVKANKPQPMQAANLRRP